MKRLHFSKRNNEVMNKITLMRLENKGVEINVDENKSLII